LDVTVSQEKEICVKDFQTMWLSMHRFL